MRVLKSPLRTTPIQAIICLMIGTALWPAEIVGAQARRPAGGQGHPSVTAVMEVSLAEGSLAQSTREMTFRIAVDIPAGHHGYIDRGDDGFLIPFSFSFPGLEEESVVVEMTSAPLGVRDVKVRAQVLRGRADFGFRLIPAPLPTADATADLRYQICNDVTGICYPPAVLRIPVVNHEIIEP